MSPQTKAGVYNCIHQGKSEKITTKKLLINHCCLLSFAEKLEDLWFVFYTLWEILTNIEKYSKGGVRVKQNIVL